MDSTGCDQQHPRVEVVMLRSRIGLLAIASVTWLMASCSAEGGRSGAPPVAPSPAQPSAAAPGVQAGISSAARTHGLPLTAVEGSGSGIVNVTTTAGAIGFSAEITVEVHGARPDADLFVQRAPELGRANSADGVCQRAMGIAPWGPPAPNFVTFPIPLNGPLLVLHTSPGGSGSAHISFDLPSIADGIAFDVMFRLVDSTSSPTNELRTECFTVTAK
jgi:hypothetical protein